MARIYRPGARRLLQPRKSLERTHRWPAKIYLSRPERSGTTIRSRERPSRTARSGTGALAFRNAPSLAASANKSSGRARRPFCQEERQIGSASQKPPVFTELSCQNRACGRFLITRESRRQKTEDRRRKTEFRRQETERRKGTEPSFLSPVSCLLGSSGGRE